MEEMVAIKFMIKTEVVTANIITPRQASSQDMKQLVNSINITSHSMTMIMVLISNSTPNESNSMMTILGLQRERSPGSSLIPTIANLLAIRWTTLRQPRQLSIMIWRLNSHRLIMDEASTVHTEVNIRCSLRLMCTAQVTMVAISESKLSPHIHPWSNPISTFRWHAVARVLSATWTISMVSMQSERNRMPSMNNWLPHRKSKKT